MIKKICFVYERDATEREDLFQEIVVQAWRSYPSFKEKSKFSTWLYRIAINTAVTMRRKSKSRINVKPLRDQIDIADDSTDHDLEEDLAMLRNAIDRLNAVEKAIILLYLEEKSYQEMSEIIGISQKNVGVRIVRIKSKLSNLLKPHYGI